MNNKFIKFIKQEDGYMMIVNVPDYLSVDELLDARTHFNKIYKNIYSTEDVKDTAFYVICEIDKKLIDTNEIYKG